MNGLHKKQSTAVKLCTAHSVYQSYVLLKADFVTRILVKGGSVLSDVAILIFVFRSLPPFFASKEYIDSIYFSPLSLTMGY